MKSERDNTRLQNTSQKVTPLPIHYQESYSRKRKNCCGYSLWVISAIIFVGIALWVYASTMGRTNVLLLGIDSREYSNLGRSDTIILVTFAPSPPYIGMLSIPRDLWVIIPGYGENRINTAHFFGEANQPGSGPDQAMATVRANFGVDVDYYIALNHVGFLEMIDQLGGIDINLEKSILGLSPGSNHLNGEQALALIRDRSGSDDFSRMKTGQIFIKALMQRLFTLLINPNDWGKIPNAIKTILGNIKTNIPIWRLPQFGLTFLLVGFDGIDTRIINRDMVSPFMTSGGANVLAPLWERINPLLLEMFGQ